MALTIKHLNTDASFLLTFKPIIPASDAYQARPSHILLDPWITGPSKIFHSKISLTRHKEPACIASLDELPTPDLVIITQAKTDHCNEATLRQIPPGAKTLILAGPAAARIIRKWNHFDRRRVWALKKWGESESPCGGGGAGRNAVTSIPLPPVVRGGAPGEVTVTDIPQRRDLARLHAAVGITFRPPLVHSGSGSIKKLSSSTAASNVPFVTTPPATPKSYKSYSNLQVSTNDTDHAPAYPPLRLSGGATTHQTPANEPASPAPTVTSLRSVRSASTLTPTTTTHSNLELKPTLTNSSTLASVHAHTQSPNSQRTLSLLFSPHGMPFAGPLSSYATTHLINEAALPLTALLHCFDSVSNPWWLGGNVLRGAPAGREIALQLGARVWVSSHDGKKEVQGLATGWLRTRKWERTVVQRGVWGEAEDEEEDVQAMPNRGKRPVTSAGGKGPETPRTMSSGYSARVGQGTNQVTKVLELASGEEVVLTSEGVWIADQRTLPRTSSRTRVDLEERSEGFHAMDEVVLQGLGKPARDAGRVRVRT